MMTYAVLAHAKFHTSLLASLWYICIFTYVLYLISNLIFWNKPKQGIELNTLKGVFFYFLILIVFRFIRIFTGDTSDLLFLYITCPFFIFNSMLWILSKKK